MSQCASSSAKTLAWPENGLWWDSSMERSSITCRKVTNGLRNTHSAFSILSEQCIQSVFWLLCLEVVLRQARMEMHVSRWWSGTWGWEPFRILTHLQCRETDGFYSSLCRYIHVGMNFTVADGPGCIRCVFLLDAMWRLEVRLTLSWPVEGRGRVWGCEAGKTKAHAEIWGVIYEFRCILKAAN